MVVAAEERDRRVVARRLGRMVAAAVEHGRRVVACASTLHARAVREHTACTLSPALGASLAHNPTAPLVTAAANTPEKGQ